jgi:hypothetical protein
MSVRVPIGFLSHTSDDKDRFVLGFAEKLRKHGIELWLDKWEILPGDKIVGKIFEEGLKNAEVIIVVLSTVSVAKPWVRAELEVAVVKRIEEGIRIIPVVIDEDCPIPEALKSDVRVVINDLNNYEPELKSIVNAVYGTYDKPPLGRPPRYVQTITDTLPGLEKTDSLVLKLICEEAQVDRHNDSKQTWIHTDAIWEKAQSLDVPLDEFCDSIEILNDDGYISGDKRNTGEAWSISIFRLSNYGFEEYAKAWVADYDSICRSVISRIVNEKDDENIAIATVLNQPLVVVNHILDMLAEQRRLKLFKPMNTDGVWTIIQPSPELKRLLRNS